MSFGINERGKLTGAQLAVRIMQACAVAASLFTFIVPGYLSLLTHRGVLSTLFELGFGSIPRIEAILLSYLYRLTSSEIALHFGLLGFALVFGLVMWPLLSGKPKKAIAVRVVFAVWIVADLILRLIPMHINEAFGLHSAIFGFIVRLCCLGLIIADLIVCRRKSRAEEQAPQPPAE